MSINRRQFLHGAGALATSSAAAGIAGCATKVTDSQGQIFEAHCHIIDHRFPIVPNQGYVPPNFTLDDYLGMVTPLGITAGAIVSGSFHGFDQTYMRATLPRLGPRWVGVTQVPPDITDAEVAELKKIGVHALRFNIFRGRIDTVDDIVALATRVHNVAGWHAEIYADAASLRPHVAKLSKLPQIVIDHLGMSATGLPVVLDLVDAGARIKATGFGRVDMDVPKTLQAIAARNPRALMFGTDIPSTRAKRPFMASDIQLVKDALGPELARRALWSNGVELYKPKL